jgi:hypothetical protein
MGKIFYGHDVNDYGDVNPYSLIENFQNNFRLNV